MKKLALLIAAVMLLMPLAACGGRHSSVPNNPTFKPSQVGPKVEFGSKPGKLYFVEIEPDFTVTALQISGNRAGSQEFNAREPAMEDIRSIFELNEQIDFVLSYNTPVEGKYGFYVCTHRDYSDYDTKTIAAESVYSDEGEFGDYYEAEFYLNPEENAPGDYDLLFVKDGTVRVYTVIRLYNEGELSGLSDAELEAIMEAAGK